MGAICLAIILYIFAEYNILVFEFIETWNKKREEHGAC